MYSVLNSADQYFQSWTDYTYAQEDIFQPTNQWVKTFSRTYPQAISGIPINMAYNRDTYQFELCFQPDLSITMPTEIYFTKLDNITVSSNLKYNIDQLITK